MKTKLFIFATLVTGLTISSCKKDEDMGVTGEDNTPTLSTNLNTITLNDTVDYTTASFCSDYSIKLDKDSIHTDSFSVAEYSISSVDSACVFANTKRSLQLNAGNNAFMITDYNISLPSGVAAKKFALGDIVNYANSDGASSSTGSVRGNILLNGATTAFTQNSTAYLGLIFSRGSDNYHGWLKIKILGNYACVLESYTVSTDANLAVKIQ